MTSTGHFHHLVEKHGSIRAAARHLEMAESTLRGWLKQEKQAATVEAAELPDHAFIPDANHFPTHIGEQGIETVDFWGENHPPDAGTKRYILTSAQNNVEVHRGFLTNLEALAKSLDAQLLISFSIYDRHGYRGLVRKGESQIKKQDVWWDKAVEPYAFNVRAKLHERLAFCGELDVLATTKSPLAGLESYCGRSSIIVPHNRFAFKCVASRKKNMPKEMYTTGSVTTRKFIQRKAGQVAHFHHVIGALLVEVTADGFFHVHHLNAEEDGSFYWLDTRVENGNVMRGFPIEGLVLGDIHNEKIDPATVHATLHHPQSVVKMLKPDKMVVHDLIDFTNRNHHTIRDPIHKVRQRHKSVHGDIKQAAQFLRDLQGVAPYSKINIVRSNHDCALDRWIKETDWRDDPMNAEFYLDIARAMVISAAHNEEFNPLKFAIERELPYDSRPDFTFLDLDEPLEIAGIECGIHGHTGPNGSKGSPRAFSRLGFKTFTAHTHSPSIVDGCYTVGVMGKLDMGYNVGPSNWMHTHGIIYQNGKRGFLFIKNGRWRAP